MMKECRKGHGHRFLIIASSFLQDDGSCHFDGGWEEPLSWEAGRQVSCEKYCLGLIHVLYT